MAKKATTSGSGKKRSTKSAKPTAAPRALAATRTKPAATRRPVTKASGRQSNESTAADALLKLLESPLVADLLAVGATAALAALAETRFGRNAVGEGGRSSKALKTAAKAAATAIGRRLSTEFDEIRKVSKKATGGG